MTSCCGDGCSFCLEEVGSTFAYADFAAKVMAPAEENSD